VALKFWCHKIDPAPNSDANLNFDDKKLKSVIVPTFKGTSGYLLYGHKHNHCLLSFLNPWINNNAPVVDLYLPIIYYVIILLPLVLIVIVVKLSVYLSQ